MRSLLVVCLWLLVACKSIMRAPVSDLHAVTDGKITLGVVASENAEGLQVYRLLLCKRQINYSDTRVFSDNSKCRPALIDNGGQEVVIFPDGLRRPFAAKLINYGKIVLGTALVAGAVFGGYRWFYHRPGGKFIKGLSDKADEVYQANKVRIEKQHNVDMDEIKKRLDAELVSLGINDGGDLSEKMLAMDAKQIFDGVASGELSINKLEKALDALNKIDTGLGDMVDDLITSSALGDVDKKSLNKLSALVADYDVVFARRLATMQELRRPIDDSDVRYAFSHFRDSERVFEQIMGSAKLRKIADGSLTFDAFTSVEQAALIQRQRIYEDLSAVIQLRALEIKRNIVTRIIKKNGSYDQTGLAETADTMKRLGMFNSDTQKLIDEGADLDKIVDAASYDAALNPHSAVLSRLPFRDFMVEGYQKNIKELFNKPKAGSRDYVYSYKNILNNFVKLPPQEQLLAIERYAHKNLVLNGDYFAEAVRGKYVDKLDAIINDLSSLLLKRRAEDAGYENIFAKKNELWEKIGSLTNKEPELLDNQVAELAQDIENWWQDVLKTQNMVLSSRGDELAEMNQSLVRLIKEEQEHALKRMQDTLQLAEQGRNSEVALAVKLAKEQQQIDLLFTLASAVGASAVLTSLDKSIWGYGEKQLGGYWSQIFNDKASFTDATAVENMPAVLNKLAEIFGHKVNIAALQLAH